MESHRTTFSLQELGRVMGGHLLVIGLVTGTVLLLNRLNWLPESRSVRTTDEVLFAHRQDALRTSRAGVVIIGDSSSAIDVEAATLQELLPGHPEVANQGLLLGLPLPLYAEAAAQIVSRRTEQPTFVVLLFTPAQLVEHVVSAYHVNLWHRLRGVPDGDESPAPSALDVVRISQGRLVNPLLPWIGSGRAGTYLPNVLRLDQHLRAHQGSLVERGSYGRIAPPPETDWQVHPSQLRQAGGLRSALGGSAILIAGISPMPESAVGANYPERRDHMLRQLNETLHADLLLTNLPATFPNGFCVSEAHLNAQGAQHFTRLLAVELARLMRVGDEKKP